MWSHRRKAREPVQATDLSEKHSKLVQLGYIGKSSTERVSLNAADRDAFVRAPEGVLENVSGVVEFALPSGDRLSMTWPTRRAAGRQQRQSPAQAPRSPSKTATASTSLPLRPRPHFQANVELRPCLPGRHPPAYLRFRHDFDAPGRSRAPERPEKLLPRKMRRVPGPAGTSYWRPEFGMFFSSVCLATPVESRRPADCRRSAVWTCDWINWIDGDGASAIAKAPCSPSSATSSVPCGTPDAISAYAAA